VTAEPTVETDLPAVVVIPPRAARALLRILLAATESKPESAEEAA